MKKRRLILLSFLAVLLLFPQIARAQAPVKLWIHGDYVTSDAYPFIENNRTLVPLRVISENLGCEVKWDGASRKVTVTKSGLTATLTIGNRAIAVTKGGVDTTITTEVAAKISNNRTFVPIRAIGELFGEVVDWDKNGRTVVIGTGYTPQANPSPSMDEVEQEVLQIVRKEFKGLCDVEYDKESKVMIMRPVGETATFFRNVRFYPNLGKDYVKEWRGILEDLRELSSGLEENSGIPFGIIISNPDNKDRMLMAVRSGKIEYDFLSNPIFEN